MKWLVNIDLCKPLELLFCRIYKTIVVSILIQEFAMGTNLQ